MIATFQVRQALFGVIRRWRVPMKSAAKSYLPILYFQESPVTTNSCLLSKEQDETEVKNTLYEQTTAPHFRSSQTRGKLFDELTGTQATTDQKIQYTPYTLPHPIWDDKDLDSVKITHKPPEGFVNWLAFLNVKLLRHSFDLLSGFAIGQRNEKKWINRVIFLETVAGVPGMVAGMARHLHSLRRLKRDHGWIHTLLEEAENERMHLISALMVKQPSMLFRGCVLIAQGIFVNWFFIVYLISPRFCHRFVGYLEEEAVKTYTKLLKDIDSGVLPKWENMEAPDVAKHYWKLKPDALMRDMFRAIRADEAHHRDVNHTLSSLDPDQENPFPPGQ